MCGRFTLRAPGIRIRTLFDLPSTPVIAPRYNIAPSQRTLAIRLVEGVPLAQELKWGLVPSWADDPKIGYRLINARAETVAEKPSFRAAFKHRRCLIPADGWYEWQKLPDGKQPFLIDRADAAPFAFAGLFEAWEKHGERIDSFTLITTTANSALAAVHDRMPVVLPQSAMAAWLDPKAGKADLQELLQPAPEAEFRCQPVSTWVNSPAHDDERCVATLPASPSLAGQE